jgi:hypothetical protein
MKISSYQVLDVVQLMANYKNSHLTAFEVLLRQQARIEELEARLETEYERGFDAGATKTMVEVIATIKDIAETIEYDWS